MNESNNLELDTLDYWYATSQEFRDALDQAEERFNNLLAADMLISPKSSEGIDMTPITKPKTPIIIIMNRFLSTWLDSYYNYLNTLDRVDGVVQWTPESVEVLDTIHDTLVDNFLSELNNYDLNTRNPL